MPYSGLADRVGFPQSLPCQKIAIMLVIIFLMKVRLSNKY